MLIVPHRFIGQFPLYLKSGEFGAVALGEVYFEGVLRKIVFGWASREGLNGPQGLAKGAGLFVNDQGFTGVEAKPFDGVEAGFLAQGLELELKAASLKRNGQLVK